MKKQQILETVNIGALRRDDAKYIEGAIALATSYKMTGNILPEQEGGGCVARIKALGLSLDGDDTPSATSELLSEAVPVVINRIKNKEVLPKPDKFVVASRNAILYVDEEMRRLKQNIKEDRQIIIAFDFDGTLCTGDSYPEIGEANKTMIAMAKAYKQCGAYLILWTCRTGKALDQAVEWCKQQGVCFDKVNEHSDYMIGKYGEIQGLMPAKIYADIVYDDHAYNAVDETEMFEEICEQDIVDIENAIKNLGGVFND